MLDNDLSFCFLLFLKIKLLNTISIRDWYNETC